MLAFVVKNNEVKAYMRRWIKNVYEIYVVQVQEHDSRLFRARKTSFIQKSVNRTPDIYVIDLEVIDMY